MTTPFYCEVCEMNSYVSISGGITTDGFEVTCPECNTVFYFDSVTYQLDEEEVRKQKAGDE